MHEPGLGRSVEPEAEGGLPLPGQHPPAVGESKAAAVGGTLQRRRLGGIDHIVDRGAVRQEIDQRHVELVAVQADGRRVDQQVGSQHESLQLLRIHCTDRQLRVRERPTKRFPEGFGPVA